MIYVDLKFQVKYRKHNPTKRPKFTMREYPSYKYDLRLLRNVDRRVQLVIL